MKLVLSTRLAATAGLSLAATLSLLSIVASGQGGSAGQLQQPDRQMPPVTFRVAVNYVEVDATVVDRQGQFVGDLKKDDFEVYEDGKRQKVDAFSLVNIPVERADKPLFVRQAIEPDVQTNTRGMDGRLYLIVLDDLHTAVLRSPLVRNAARRFVQERIGANDLAAIVTTSGQNDVTQEFTNNRSLLTQAIDKFMGRKLRSPTLEKLEQYGRNANLRGTTGAVSDPTEAERAYNARRMLASVRDLSEFMAAVHGRRKALILFSEGIDYDVNDPIDNAYASDIIDGVRDVISAATRANVNVYTVDPRGLTDMGDEMMEMSSIPGDPSLGLTPEAMMAELRLSQDSLRVLADDTGGFAAVNTNDFGNAFTRIVNENSSYYVLGYYTSNDKRDGKVRKLDVKVNRPGTEVHARKEYVAPTGKPRARTSFQSESIKSPEIREALDSPVPMSGLGLAVAAAPFKGTAPNASVVVTVQARGPDLTFVERSGHFDDNIAMSLIAVDHDGKVAGGDNQALNMTLKPESRAVVQQAGIRFTSRLNLPPGRYQLRVASHESEGGRVGSVYYDLVIPDFGRLPLSMSGLVLSSTRAGLTPTPRPDEELRKALPGPPTAVRDFLSDDELAVLVEVYDNQGAAPHKVTISSVVLAEDGRTVFQHADERASAEFAGKSGGYGYTTRIPLREIPPGLYVLRVEAKSSLGKNEAASREVQFTVRPPAK